MTVFEFVERELTLLTAFQAAWRMKNLVDPETYPIEISEDNSGLWHEMYEQFASQFNENPSE